nr:hypothetical protein [Rhizobium leguminosarum]
MEDALQCPSMHGQLASRTRHVGTARHIDVSNMLVANAVGCRERRSECRLPHVLVQENADQKVDIGGLWKNIAGAKFDRLNSVGQVAETAMDHGAAPRIAVRNIPYKIDAVSVIKDEFDNGEGSGPFTQVPSRRISLIGNAYVEAVRDQAFDQQRGWADFGVGDQHGGPSGGGRVFARKDQISASHQHSPWFELVEVWKYRTTSRHDITVRPTISPAIASMR